MDHQNDDKTCNISEDPDSSNKKEDISDLRSVSLDAEIIGQPQGDIPIDSAIKYSEFELERIDSKLIHTESVQNDMNDIQQQKFVLKPETLETDVSSTSPVFSTLGDLGKEEDKTGSSNSSSLKTSIAPAFIEINKEPIELGNSTSNSIVKPANDTAEEGQDEIVKIIDRIKWNEPAKIIGFRIGSVDSEQLIKPEEACSFVERRYAELTKDFKNQEFNEGNPELSEKFTRKRKPKKKIRMQMSQLKRLLESGLTLSEDIEQSIIAEAIQNETPHLNRLIHRLNICHCYTVVTRLDENFISKEDYNEAINNMYNSYVNKYGVTSSSEKVTDSLNENKDQHSSTEREECMMEKKSLSNEVDKITFNNSGSLENSIAPVLIEIEKKSIKLGNLTTNNTKPGNGTAQERQDKTVEIKDKIKWDEPAKIVGFRMSSVDSEQVINPEEASSLVERQYAILTEESVRNRELNGGDQVPSENFIKRNARKLIKIKLHHLKRLFDCGLILSDDIKQKLLDETLQNRVSHVNTLMHRLKICHCYSVFTRLEKGSTLEKNYFIETENFYSKKCGVTDLPKDKEGASDQHSSTKPEDKISSSTIVNETSIPSKEVDKIGSSSSSFNKPSENSSVSNFVQSKYDLMESDTSTKINTRPVNDTSQILERGTAKEVKDKMVEIEQLHKPPKIMGLSAGSSESDQLTKREEATSLVESCSAESGDHGANRVEQRLPRVRGRGNRNNRRKKKRLKKLKVLLESNLTLSDNIKQSLLAEASYEGRPQIPHQNTLLHAMNLCNCDTGKPKVEATKGSSTSRDKCGVTSSTEKVVDSTCQNRDASDLNSTGSDVEIIEQPPEVVVIDSDEEISTAEGKTFGNTDPGHKGNSKSSHIAAEQSKHTSSVVMNAGSQSGGKGNCQRTSNKTLEVQESGSRPPKRTRVMNAPNTSSTQHADRTGVNFVSSMNPTPPKNARICNSASYQNCQRTISSQYLQNPPLLPLPYAPPAIIQSVPPPHAANMPYVTSPASFSEASHFYENNPTNFAIPPPNHSFASPLQHHHNDSSFVFPPPSLKCASPLVVPPLLPEADSSFVAPPPLGDIPLPSSVESGDVVSQNAKLESEEQLKRKLQVLIMSNRDRGIVYPDEKEPVRRYLVAEMLKSMVTAGPTGPELHFKQAGMVDPGWFSVHAENDVSFAWLLNGCPTFSLNQATFRSVRALEVSKISLPLTTTTVDIKLLLSILVIQNRSLKVNTWIHLATTGKPESWNVIFLITSEVAKKLKSQQWTVYYEIDKLEVRLLPLSD